MRSYCALYNFLRSNDLSYQLPLRDERPVFFVFHQAPTEICTRATERSRYYYATEASLSFQKVHRVAMNPTFLGIQIFCEPAMFFLKYFQPRFQCVRLQSFTMNVFLTAAQSDGRKVQCVHRETALLKPHPRPRRLVAAASSQIMGVPDTAF